MRVLRIIARMNVGGPALEVTELMRGLDPGQIEQRLLTGWCADDEADFLLTQAPELPVVRLSGLGRAVRPGDDAKVLWELVREIRTYRPDVVHTHTAKAGVLGRLAAKLSGLNPRVVHTYHGHLLHGYFGAGKTRAVVQIERGFARGTDRLITVGARVRDDLLAAGIGRPAQYEVIRSGVRLGAVPDLSLARAELGIPTDARVVSVIGRLTRIKRPDRVAEVARQIRALHPDAIFLVAGSGDEQEALAELVMREQLPIRMLGWRSDIERLLGASDVVLLTSDNEGTPLSLAQAAIAGVPAVATDVGSVSEVVIDGVSGLVRPPDATLLTEALDALLSDDGRRIAMGLAARDYVESTYSMETFLHDHQALYQSLVREK